MIAKTTIKTDTLEKLDEIVEDARKKYQELTDNNPSTTYTLFVNESKLTVKIKVLDLGIQVN